MSITGTLLDVGTFSSHLRKFDGTVIRIPNEKFFTSNIHSLSTSTVRRAEAMVGIEYRDDIDNAISVIKKEIEITMPFILRIPEPEFHVVELGDSSVDIQVLVWHPREDWSQAQPILLTAIKRALDNSGIEIPSPQRVLWQAKE